MGAIGTALAAPYQAAAGTGFIGGPAFGSSWRGMIETSADETAMQRLIQGIITGVNARFSPYLPESELSRFNVSRSTEWRAISSEFELVIGEALRIAELTDGFFDPTVGPLVARYGFGPISGRAASLSNIQMQRQCLRKRSPQATLDLCGIAKGYALDQIVLALEAVGVGRAVLDVGGEVRALGKHPADREWTVAIADPKRSGSAHCIVTPGYLALATSGHAANGIRGRVNTSHIIDPHRQRPAEQSLLSVSVLDRSAMRADAHATALCAAGAEIGPDMAQRLEIPALFLLDDAERMTGGFDKYILI